jgi:hypothetical protein
MYTLGIRVTTRQIRQLRTLSVSNALRHASAGSSSAPDDVSMSVDVFSKNNVSIEDTFYIREGV